VDVHEVLSDKEVEEFSLSKLRLKRRLHARWKCKAIEHSYCYVDARLDLHIQLSDPDIDKWVNMIVCSSSPPITGLLKLNISH